MAANFGQISKAQADRDRKSRIAEALRKDVFGMQPEVTVQSLAGHLTVGSDDPEPVSLATIYKALEGQRKIPLHKIAMISELSEGKHLAREIARQSGLQVIDLDAEVKAPDDLSDLLRGTANLMDAEADARHPDSPGGRGYTKTEAAKTADHIDQLVDYLSAYKRHIMAEAHTVKIESRRMG